MSQIINRKKISSGEPLCHDTEKAYSILLLGQTELAKNNLEKGLTLFSEASAIKPEDPKLYFEQGLSLVDFGTEEGKEKTLLAANKKIKQATTLFPEYFEAWHLWGLSLSFLGKTYEETHYFFEAEKKLLKAVELSNKADAEQLFDLYFELGSVKTALAKRSGEACDWQTAIDAFDKASTVKNIKDIAFWNQFGLASLKLAALLCDVKLCVKSIHCFKCAITQESNSYESWKNLSKSMEFLYERTHDEDHFVQANECFNTAIQLAPLDAPFWLEWAQFLAKSGKVTEDTRRLRLAIEKCTKAYEIDPTLPEVLACWGEALSLVGEKGEQIELIHEGQNKATEATEMDPSNPELFRALGETLNCLGRYFEDADYHYQAIEKFQAGLTIDRSKHALWFAIGSTYTQVGKLLNDTETLEQALYFYKKAIDLNSSISYYHFGQAHCLSKIGELLQKEDWLESSIAEFERALYIQKNAVYLHPDWLFQYGKTLDLYAEFFGPAPYLLGGLLAPIGQDRTETLALADLARQFHDGFVVPPAQIKTVRV